MKLASPALRSLATAWHGVIPDDWEVQRFKHLATIRNGQVDPEDPRFRDLSLLAPNHIESGTGRLLGIESADKQGAESGKYLVRKGEIVYSKIRPALRKVALAPCDGLCSADMYPVAPRNHADVRFLFFEMLSEGFSRYSVLESDRVAMPKINRDALGECPFVFPELSRQEAIASFLDRKTAAIDALIAKKERLTELLQEKRQALITQAVTKGLDPKVTMKDSGSVWLGKIPAHWKKVPLGYLCRIYNGSTPSREEPEYWTDGAIPWLTSGKVHEGRIEGADEYVTERALRECHLPMVPAGSVLVAITGEGKTRGTVALLPARATTSQHIAAITPTGSVMPEFLWRYLSSLYRWLRFESSGGGSTKAAITCEFLRTVPVVVPPLAEQVAICIKANDRTVESDGLIRKSRAMVDLLREYRQALISAAVTGKIEIPAEEAA